MNTVNLKKTLIFFLFSYIKIKSSKWKFNNSDNITFKLGNHVDKQVLMTYKYQIRRYNLICSTIIIC